MKKKRKKKNAIRLSLHGLGNAPDDSSVQSRSSCFSDRLFGSNKSNVDFQETVFAITVAENTIRNWQTVIYDQTMFVFIPDNPSQIGSKESFVSLLEIAEEDLGCSFVISCVGNDSTDKLAYMRTFRYMGFEVIDPSHPIINTVANESNFIFLAYEL